MTRPFFADDVINERFLSRTASNWISANDDVSRTMQSRWIVLGFVLQFYLKKKPAHANLF